MIKKSLSLLLFIFIINLQVKAQPSKTWLSYFGQDETRIKAIHYDKVSNCIYITGSTSDSIGIATPGSFEEILPTQNPTQHSTFLAKFDLDGNRIWSTYYTFNKGIGSTAHCYIKTDYSGNIYLLNNAKNGMATSGYFDSWAALLTKFTAQGERLWATYLSPVDTSIINGFTYYGTTGGGTLMGLDIDEQNNVYVTTGTGAISGIATPGAYQSELNTPDTLTTYPILLLYNADGALLKYDSNGVKQWGTYFGGTRNDHPSSIHYSSDGFIYVTGHGSYLKSGYGTPGTFRTEPPSEADTSRAVSFLNKFSSSGQLIWSTYIWGQKTAFLSQSLTGDNDGNIYLLGTSEFSGLDTHDTTNRLTTPSALSEFPLSADDLMLFKFSPQGQRIWGTYFGGPFAENLSLNNSFNHGAANSLRYSPNQNSLYFVASTQGNIDSLVTNCSYKTNGSTRGIIANIDTSGQLIWASHFDEIIGDIAFKDNAGEEPTDIFISGFTSMDSLATENAFKNSKNTNWSSFFGRFKDSYDCSLDTLNLTWNPPLLIVNSGFENYQWYYNDSLIVNVNSTSYNPGNDTFGYYSVVAEKCGCFYKSQAKYFNETRISDLGKNKNKIDLFPNPATGEFINISLPDVISNSAQDAYVQITDIAGKIVLSSSSKITKNQIDFHIKTLISGFYFINIQIGKEYYYGKFVKQ